jgi:hypothetical protein
MNTTGKNRIMIYGPKNDGTYIVEFKTAEGRGVGDQQTLPGANAFMGYSCQKSVRNIPPRQGFPQWSPHVQTQPP